MADILNAAEEIVAERGYDSLTLTEVAERSNSAIGSLYRFFSSKEQLAAALVERLANSLATDSAHQLSRPPLDADASTFVSWYAVAIASIVKRHPAMPALLEHLGAHCEPIEEHALQPVRTYLAVRAPRLTKLERALILRVVLEMLKAALRLPVSVRGATRAQADRELHIVLVAYLKVRLSHQLDGN